MSDDEDREHDEALDRAEDAEMLDPPGEQRTVDAGSKQEYRKRQRSQKEQEKARVAFWANLFKDPIGRAEVWRIIQVECRAFEERFMCSPTGMPDPQATFFAAGQQSIGLRLYQQFLVLDPQGVMLMHTEHDPRFAKGTK